jgi:hypothetical protein
MPSSIFAELAQELVPLDDLEALLGGRNGGKEGEEAFDTTRRELNREAHGVN